MESIRKSGIIVGILFIVATVAPLASAPFSAASRASDYLVAMSADQGRIIVGALLELVMAIAIAGIAIFAFPVLRKQNEGLALGYVGLRLIEGVFMLVSSLAMVSLLPVSQEFSGSASPHLLTLGTLLQAVRDWAGHGFATIAFCLSGLALYSLLYKSRLVPRWLAGWGFIGAALSLISNLYSFLNHGLGFSTVQIILDIPVALNEMVLAVWLIARGFDKRAAASIGSN